MAQVYQGVWISWVNGPIYGRTLTLTRQNSDLLQAFLTLLVSFAGGQFWKLIAFYLHRFYTGRHEPKDGLQLQIEVTLCNTAEPISAAKTFTSLGFRWYHLAPQALLRCLPLAILAIGSFVVFTIAGIFTSLVTQDMDNKMLIAGGRCGAYFITPGHVDYDIKLKRDQTDQDSYVRQCYGNETDALACSTFATPQIDWTVDTNASCPFASGMCIGGDTASISFDTGMMDSNDDFGINAVENDRIQIRRVTTCSPLNLDSRHSTVNITIPALELVDRRSVVYFGERVNGSQVNGTALYDNVTSSISDFSIFELGHGYQVDGVFAFDELLGDWIPIPELNRTDADVSVVFLSQNSVYYLAPVDDPFFAAHTLIGPTDDVKDDTYIMDHAITALGCTDQFQICNQHPKNGPSPFCSKLGSFSDENKVEVYDSSNGYNQLSTLSRLLNAAVGAPIYYSIFGRDASSLRAADSLFGDFQTLNLTATQWQLEASVWFAQGLVHMQQSILDYANNDKNIPIRTPQSPGEIHGCQSQIVGNNSGMYQNLSVLGIGLVMAFALFIILLSVIVGPIHRFVDGRTAQGSRATDERQAQRLFQLLISAAQGAGYLASWTGKDRAVPVTFQDDKFVGVRHFRQNPEWNQIRKSQVEIVEDGESQGLIYHTK